MENEYLSEFQIIGTSIKNLKIKNDFIILDNSSKIRRKFDLSHSVASIGVIEEGTVLSGTVILNIKVSISKGDKKYKLDMSIEGCFNAPAKIGKDKFDNLLQVNGITALYSIARAFIQSTSTQTLAFGSILLPMVNVVAYSKSVELKEQQKKS